MSLLATVTLLALHIHQPPLPQDQGGPAQVPAPATTEDAWPRVFQREGGSVTVYPPTLTNWDGAVVKGTCAMAIAQQGASTQAFGTLSFEANTETDRLSRLVVLRNLKVTGVSLPENPAGQDAMESELSAKSAGRVIRVSLDRFEAAARHMASAPTVASAPLRNDPPAITITQMPTVLVPIQGDPVLRPLDGTSLQRVMNTPMLLVQDGSGSWSLKIADGWLTASALSGPFAIGDGSNADLVAAATWAKSQPGINLLAPSEDAGDGAASAVSLAQSVPQVLVSTQPAELIVLDGPAAWVPLGDSGLSYASNTSAHLFRKDDTSELYVLVSGRWFVAPNQGGPWSHVPGDKLPTSFRMIPEEGAKENVLASVPGTMQAQEATIANAIPQMARVPHDQGMPALEVHGSPQWNRIDGTRVDVLQNCATPVFRTSSGNLFAVVSGVWFRATSLDGPWSVATSVDSDLYSIPPSSPYYYVTFVRVYSTTSDYVLMGYTPGYFGAYPQGGTIVYGTGYWYRPWCDGYWVPAPWTYGCGAALCYSPWAGWSYGFGMGLATGWAIGASTWRCGPYPCWGPYYGGYGAHGAYAWGPGGWAATTGNVYHHWGNVSTMTRGSAGYNAWTGNAWATHTGVAYNSVTGAREAGQRGYVENAYTGNWAAGARGAGYNPTTGNYAAGRGFEAGNANGQEVAAGTATVGNARTGNSARVAGVETENGSWGAVNTGQGAAVAHDGQVYGMHDGNAYHYDSSSSSWNRYSGNGNWSKVDDESTRRQLDAQAATRGDGDARARQNERWQSGGEGFSGDRENRSSGNRSWGGGRSYGGSRGGGRSGGGRR